MKKEPLVLVAAPVWEGHKYCIKRYLDRVKNLSYHNYKVLLVDNSKGKKFFRYLVAQKFIKVLKSPFTDNPIERIALARNYIVDYLLTHPEYKYLMSIDTDTIIPRNGIEKLLKHKKDLVGFLCHMGFKNKQPAVLKTGHILHNGRFGLNHYSWEEIRKMKSLQKVYGTSIGCLLIHRKVFEDGVKFRYTPAIHIGEDLWFYGEVAQHGFNMYLDKTVRVLHLNRDRRGRIKDVKKAVRKWRRKNRCRALRI